MQDSKHFVFSQLNFGYNLNSSDAIHRERKSQISISQVGAVKTDQCKNELLSRWKQTSRGHYNFRCNSPMGGVEL